MSRSLRGRILLLLTAVLSGALAVMALWSYRDAQHEIEEVFDAQLVQAARLVAGLGGRDMGPEARRVLQSALDEALSPAQGAVGPGRFSHEYEGKLGFAVLDAGGAVLLHSASLPVHEFRALRIERRSAAREHPGDAGAEAELLLGTPAGFHDAVIGTERWNVFLLNDRRSGHWILVGDRDDVRDELARLIAARGMVPELVGLPLVALLAWLVVGWSLRPLGRMARMLRSRAPGDLSPVLVERAPEELEPVVASLNRLLAQVTGLLDREKRFLSYAAHELRTPLAVLRLQADNAMRAPDPADREAALRQLDRSVSRATRMVEQLLALARLEPGTVALQPSRLDLLQVARREIAELGPIALDREQDLALEADEGGDFRVVADEACVQSLLQNLISNAVRHAPAGGRVRVCLEAQRDRVRLHVQDSGPGVPPGIRERVFERFFREGPAQGAGLGLSIVARIVELHAGTIELHDGPLGGLEAVVTLPRELPGAAADARASSLPVPGRKEG